MRGVNKVILLGRAGRDPEVRYTRSGNAVTTLSIATDSSWTKDGERHEKTEWHRVVAWSKLAEIVKEYLVKGRQVYIEGRLQTRKWQDKDDNTRYQTEIVADQIIMLGNKQETTHGKDMMEMVYDGDAIQGEFDGPAGGSF